MAKLDVSLTEEERDRFLAEGRTVRVATAGADGAPQVVALWYVWLDGTVFLNTTLGNLTVRNLDENPRAACIVDDGGSYDDLRGVVLRGRVERAGDDPRLSAVRTAWSAKYLGGAEPPYERWRNRVWLRLSPDEVASWDFRKIPDARARARSADEAGG